MIDTETASVLVTLISTVGAIVVAAINRGGWKRLDVKFNALAAHLGLKVEDGGKVIVLERPIKAPEYVHIAERKP